MKHKYSETIPDLCDFVRSCLLKISKSRTEPVSLVQRAKIILLASRGRTNIEIAEALGIGRKNAGRWRRRFLDSLPEINQLVEEGRLTECRKTVREVLSDVRRSGRPKKFTPVDHATVKALACSDPKNHGQPLGSWSSRILCDFVMEKGLISDIVSHSTISRILKAGLLRPHKLRHWIHSPDKRIDPEGFIRQARLISGLLVNAQEAYERGIQIISIDEKPGIPVYTPIHPDLPPMPGSVRKREMFYTRNGKTDLIQAINVAMGDLLPPYLSPTHKEEDFVKALESSIEFQARLTPGDQIMVLCDNLSTHKSEGVVRLVARWLNVSGGSLGAKNRKGVLKNLKSREKFLTDPSHRIRFVFTPKHGSWLNPVECYFSILQRSLLKGYVAESVEEMEDAVRRFSDWYNEHFARPFNYKFSGFEGRLAQMEKKLRPLCLPAPKPPRQPPVNILPYGSEKILLPG